MSSPTRLPNVYRKWLPIGLLFAVMALFMLFALTPSPILGAPPCGKPNTDPCPVPTATPTGSNPTPTAVPTVAPTATPTSGGGGNTLVWSDEFNGSSIDPNNWTFDIGYGNSGWGNNELQSYTDRPENARIENGSLIIEAREERIKGQLYTSARLKTQGLQSWTYGRVEARVKVAEGQGLWSAFWMLGADIDQAGWPNAGEIDIMENIGREPNTLYGTLHGPGYSGADGVGGSYLSNSALSNDYHLYAVEWDADHISWYIDNTLYSTVTPNDVPGEWVYDHPFFIIMNLAVGGNWPGSPDATTVFPQLMYVDYVRVYQ